MFQRKEKRFLVLLRKIDETYFKEKVIQIKNFNLREIPDGKNRKYEIKPSKPAYIHGLNKFYFNDIETMGVIPLIAQPSIITPEQLASLLDDKMIKDVAGSVKEKTWKERITDIILGAVSGAGITGMVIMILIQVGVF